MNIKVFKKLVSNLKQKEVDQLRNIVNGYRDIIIIGNGGSNAASIEGQDGVFATGGGGGGGRPGGTYTGGKGGSGVIIVRYKI